jgi:hypothetical protein
VASLIELVVLDQIFNFADVSAQVDLGHGGFCVSADSMHRTGIFRK